jgi:hypothetical protein
MAHIRLQQVVEESQTEIQRLRFRKVHKDVQLDKYQHARLQIAKQVKHATLNLAKHMPQESHAAALIGGEEAIRFAVSAREAEENFNSSFDTRRENRACSNSDITRHSVNTRKASQAGQRRTEIPRNASRAKIARNRNAQTKAALLFNERERTGIFARQNSTREQGSCQQQGRTRNSPGKGNPSERFRMK